LNPTKIENLSTKFLLASVLLLMGLSSQQGYAQSKTDYSQNTYRSPLDIPLLLTGNFGELRSNHFHTGIDIATQGVEGKRIYAIEEGYVSRIRVSPWGYGNVLYVNHPNGQTSVYAHLSAFSTAIDTFVRNVQYYKEKYAVDLYPGAEQLRVKKGEVIGLSGNSGGSFGPHLHFEIRETETEKALNPLLFGFKIADNVQPTIFGIRTYEFSTIGETKDENYLTDISKAYAAVGGSGSYRLRNTAPIKVNNHFGIAVNTIDKLNGLGNQCGVYIIELYADGKKVFGQEIEKINFYTNRYINCHMDYIGYRDDKDSYHKSFVMKNNKLEIYRDLVNRGFMSLADGKHQMKYVIKDAYGNESTLEFEVLVENENRGSGRGDGVRMKTDTENVFKNDEVEMYMPPNSLYEEVMFNYVKGDTFPRTLTPLHKLHNNNTPVHHYYTLKIKVDSLPEKYHDKVVMISINDKKKIYNEKGEYVDGWVRTRTRSFGNYTVMLDTVPPFIKPLNISEGKNMSSNTELAVRITDNLSGVKIFKGYIDGKWVLMQYNPKKAKYYYNFRNDEVKPGPHKFVIQAIDSKGNASSWEANFVK
jgi:murein DD-endopeptidase MepM/ murein hydrolase activator NlpD